MFEKTSVFLIFKTFSSAAEAEDIGHGLLLLRLLALLLVCKRLGRLLADSHRDGEGLSLAVNAEGELISGRAVGYD